MFNSGLLDLLALVAYELEAIPDIPAEGEDIICPQCHSLNPPEALECCNCQRSFNN